MEISAPHTGRGRAGREMRGRAADRSEAELAPAPAGDDAEALPARRVLPARVHLHGLLPLERTQAIGRYVIISFCAAILNQKT